MLMGISIAAGLLGIAISYYMYVMNTELPGKIASALGGLYTLVYNKYFVDEVYDATVVHPLVEGSHDGALARHGSGRNRRHRERSRSSVAGHRRHSEADSVRQYPKLCHLGGGGVGGLLLVAMGVAGRSSR